MPYMCLLYACEQLPHMGHFYVCCLLRDAPDGATVYVDLWTDSASGVSCHYVRSRGVRIKTAPIINMSLLSITMCK